MVEEKFAELLARWSQRIPRSADVGLTQYDPLQRAMRAAFELGVSAKANNLVDSKVDEQGNPLGFDESLTDSDTAIWSCPGPGKYGFIFQAWQPGISGQRKPTDAIVQFGWRNVDDAIQAYPQRWHQDGVMPLFPISSDDSTSLTVITMDSPVEVSIQPVHGESLEPLDDPLTISLDKNQATRRVIVYDLV